MRDSEENGQALYSVSEAVQKSGVPSHVLRYWEDELGLTIRRTSQGHRVYSEEDLATFRKVKDLKEKGIQLKAIRLLFEDTQEGRQLSQLLGREVYDQQDESLMEQLSYERQDESLVEQLSYRWGGNPAGACPAEDPDTQAEFSGAQESGIHTGGAQPDEDVEYEIIPKTETGTYRLFETMLRNLISETIAGQNEKLEAELADLIRDEIEELYIQLRQDAGEREAAAAQADLRMTPKRGNLLQRLKQMLR
ncbi:MAG: helix-turn-helix domain-containing protein [Clostridiales bacterium]|nr:helix-turn-helix domain-containing protein [Clostridiales bacterium]